MGIGACIICLPDSKEKGITPVYESNKNQDISDYSTPVFNINEEEDDTI